MKKIIICIIILIIIGLGIIFGYKLLSKDNSDIKNIFSNSKDTYLKYKAGDLVEFNDSDWYVMYDSDEKSDYVTLINSGVMYLYDEKIINTLDTVYEISNLRNYLENEYLKELGEDNLVEVYGYKIRLLNKDDIEKLTQYEYNDELDEYKITDCPEYICDINWTYATMIDTKNDKDFVDVYYNINDIEDLNDEYTLHLNYYNMTLEDGNFKLQSLVDDATLFVKPIINVYKKSLN